MRNAELSAVIFCLVMLTCFTGGCDNSGLQEFGGFA